MTLESIQPLLLLAQRSHWRYYGYRKFEGEYFESNSDEAIACLAVTFVVLAGLLVWHYYSARAKGRLPSKSPRALFRELSRTHGLDRVARRLMRRLAAARGLSNPAVLFVQPENFEPFGLPDDLRDEADELERLSARLFKAAAS